MTTLQLLAIKRVVHQPIPVASEAAGHQTCCPKAYTCRLWSYWPSTCCPPADLSPQKLLTIKRVVHQPVPIASEAACHQTCCPSADLSPLKLLAINVLSTSRCLLPLKLLAIKRVVHQTIFISASSCLAKLHNYCNWIRKNGIMYMKYLRFIKISMFAP